LSAELIKPPDRQKSKSYKSINLRTTSLLGGLNQPKYDLHQLVSQIDWQTLEPVLAAANHAITY